METLRAAVTRRGVKWDDNAASATRTIVILTKGAVTGGSNTANAIIRLLKSARRRHYIFVYSLADGWDFTGNERKGAHPIIDTALNENEGMAYRAPVPRVMRYEHDAMVDEMLARLNKA